MSSADNKRIHQERFPEPGQTGTGILCHEQRREKLKAMSAHGPCRPSRLTMETDERKQGYDYTPDRTASGDLFYNAWPERKNPGTATRRLILITRTKEVVLRHIRDFISVQYKCHSSSITVLCIEGARSGCPVCIQPRSTAWG